VPGHRFELVAIRIDVPRPEVRLAVPGRIEIAAATQQQAVHRRKGGVRVCARGPRVDRDRGPAMAANGVEVEVIPATSDIRPGLPGGHPERDDDPWRRR
jgi:hypothetical protein